MKKCPKCNKEFDDAMRFCQTDGTPLVDEAPPVDPYKTMVASPADIAAMIPPAESTPEPEQPPAASEEVLDIPAADPKKTMYASEEEIRSAMAEVDKPIVDLPPVAEPDPAPPEFIAPPAEDQPAFSKTTPPIPFPGDAPPPSAPAAQEFSAPDPEPPPFVQPEPPAPAFNPFEHSAPEPSAPIAKAEFTPTPAAQDDSRQNEQMQNPQYQPGSGIPASGGQNQTLAVVSLVSGILGLTLCCGLLIPSVVAVITGFMARGKASNDPANYGGSGLALGGLITGVIGIIGNLIVLGYVILNFAVIAAMMAGQM